MASNPSDPIALVYARNYAPQQLAVRDGSGDERPTNHLTERYPLKKFSGSAGERMDAMWGGIANRGCMYGGESQKSLFPMLKAIYEEARSLGLGLIIPQDRGFAWFAARSALAYDPNGPSDQSAIDRFIKENLQ